MDWFLLNKYSIASFSQLLLSLIITVYLAMVRNKSRPTWLLVLFFANFTATILCYFLLMSVQVPWRLYFGISQGVFGTLGQVIMIQFAYAFPQNRHLRESRLVLGISLAMLLVLGLWLGDEYRSGDPFALQVVGIAMMVEAAWVLVVLVRKTLMFNQGVTNRFGVMELGVQTGWQRWLRPVNKQARALRSFSLLMMLWLGLSGLLVLESVDVVSLETLLLSATSTYLLFLFLFVMVYMNNAPEPSNLKVKLVGISLVTMLVIMADMGVMVLTAFEKTYQTGLVKEVKRSRRALLEQKLDEIPEGVLFINGYALDTDGQNRRAERMFTRAGHSPNPFQEKYLEAQFTPDVIAMLLAEKGLDPNEAKERILQAFSRSTLLKLGAEYDYHGLIFDMRFWVQYFTLGDSLFEVVYSEYFHLKQMQAYTYPLIGFIGLTTLFILLIFPLFFRVSLDRPLQSLLGGVRRVNEGRLDVVVPVHVEDELGFLSQSFNGMVASIREAEGKLKAYAGELERSNQKLEDANRTLEQRVEERTRDLSEKNRELEQTLLELRETQNRLVMQEKMASLGQLVAGIAHEINNPIGAMKSSADVSNRCVSRIEEEVAQRESIEALRDSRRFLQSMTLLKDNNQVAISAGERVAKIAHSLRQFVHLDEAEFQRVDLHAGLESSLVLVQMGNQIRVTKDYGELDPVYCSPGQINQVFFNILKNATEAITETGEIYISTWQDGGTVGVCIRDTGKGIPGGQLEHIFDFGFTRSGGRVRLGSGLASAYNIVRRHQGEIDIQSEVGKGTEVTIRLPVQSMEVR
ncbi:MAG: ATP-binding protein [bacterium]|nr:ATP-binding protein [bacterium]